MRFAEGNEALGDNADAYIHGGAKYGGWIGWRNRPFLSGECAVIASALRFGVRAQERRVARFIKGPGRQLDNGLSRVLLRGGEAISVQFQKQDSDHKARALVAIDK